MSTPAVADQPPAEAQPQGAEERMPKRTPAVADQHLAAEAQPPGADGGGGIDHPVPVPNIKPSPPTQYGGLAEEAEDIIISSEYFIAPSEQSVRIFIEERSDVRCDSAEYSARKI